MESPASELVLGREDSISTRATLLRRLRNKEDRNSWQEFFDTYWGLIYRVARRAGLSDADAQEVVQETVIAVARKIDGFVYDPQKGSFKAWMLHLTRWRILDRLKFIQREIGRRHVPLASDAPTRTATLERVPDPLGTQLESTWDREWEQNILHRALEQTKLRVSPDSYQIYDYCVHEDMAPLKVSRLLGVNIAKVYLAKHRVARTLREELRKLQGQIRLLGEVRQAHG